MRLTTHDLLKRVHYGVRLSVHEHERIYAARALVIAVLEGKVPQPVPEAANA